MKFHTHIAVASLLLLLLHCGAPIVGTIESDADAGGDAGEESSPFEPTDTGILCTQCSADLKQIVTCGDNPQVVQTCPGDQGCGPNGCIPACDAAAANKSSIGCDYYAIPPDAWNPSYTSGAEAGSCFAAFVNNVWSTPLKVELVWKGQSIDATPYSYIPKGTGSAITYQPVPITGIPPNSMAIVFLNQKPYDGGWQVLCPSAVKVAITEDMVLHGTNISNAMEIKTTVPAIVYDIYPFGGAQSLIASGTLLLPVSAWDTNYVAVTMEENPQEFPPGIDLVAMKDNTNITVLPPVDITGANGVAGTSKNTPVTYSINKGQTVHIMQMVDSSGKDLTGAIVQSNNPIGVWGEHFCEVHNTGSWRIVGTVDGTSLKYDPPISGAPTTLSRGQLALFAGPNAIHVQSQDDQHPFYLAAHRPGIDCDAAHQQIPPVQALGYEYAAVTNETGDLSLGWGTGPETVNVIPPAQFLEQYVLFTDPTYRVTELALVRGKAGDGTYRDVTLDCSGKVLGWQPIGTSGYQYAHVDLVRGLPVGGCDNGLHTIKSDGRFGVTVWGSAQASSYAYPAGASVKPINTVVIPPTPK